MKENTRPYLHLYARIQFTFKDHKTAPYSVHTHRLSIDCFQFVVHGVKIPVDFNAYDISIIDQKANGPIKTLTFEYESGRGLFFSDSYTSEVYDEIWRENGLSPEQVTAEFLSHADSLEEILFTFSSPNIESYDILDFQVLNLNLYDQNNKFELPGTVLNKITSKTIQ